MVLPKELVKLVPKSHLMTEDEWREIGVQQSEGWQHYMTHKPGMFHTNFNVGDSSELFRLDSTMLS